MSGHLCVLSIHVYFCVCASARVSGSALPPRASTAPRPAPAPRGSPGGGRRGGRAQAARSEGRAGCAAVTAAAPTLPFKSVCKPITADLPRDVLPSVSRSELLEDSPPSTAAHRASPAIRGSSGSRNFVPGSGRCRRPHGATLHAGVGARGASLSQEGGGRGRERALATAGRPSDPRDAVLRRPAGCPVLCVGKGGALRQPRPERARPGGASRQMAAMEG